MITIVTLLMTSKSKFEKNDNNKKTTVNKKYNKKPTAKQTYKNIPNNCKQESPNRYSDCKVSEPNSSQNQDHVNSPSGRVPPTMSPKGKITKTYIKSSKPI